MCHEWRRWGGDSVQDSSCRSLTLCGRSSFCHLRITDNVTTDMSYFIKASNCKFIGKRKFGDLHINLIDCVYMSAFVLRIRISTNKVQQSILPLYFPEYFNLTSYIGSLVDKIKGTRLIQMIFPRVSIDIQSEHSALNHHLTPISTPY